MLFRWRTWFDFLASRTVWRPRWPRREPWATICLQTANNNSSSNNSFSLQQALSGVQSPLNFKPRCWNAPWRWKVAAKAATIPSLRRIMENIILAENSETNLSKMFFFFWKFNGLYSVFKCVCFRVCCVSKETFPFVFIIQW